ncbi:hypothetical protein VPHD292_0047 [Vibrio phage D292]
MNIYCCTCGSEVEARLTSGIEIYPHREDLCDLPFWICSCGSFVGCHHKTKDRTRPLGVIPSDEIKAYRRKIHAVLDPLWKNKVRTRGALYSELTQVLGREYHTAELKTVDECEAILNHIQTTYY